MVLIIHLLFLFAITTSLLFALDYYKINDTLALKCLLFATVFICESIYHISVSVYKRCPIKFREVLQTSLLIGLASVVSINLYDDIIKYNLFKVPSQKIGYSGSIIAFTSVIYFTYMLFLDRTPDPLCVK